MTRALVDALSWEVRVPVLAALAWVYAVLFGAVLLGRRRQRTDDRKHYGRITAQVLAHYREPANDAALREGAPRRKVSHD